MVAYNHSALLINFIFLVQLTNKCRFKKLKYRKKRQNHFGYRIATYKLLQFLYTDLDIFLTKFIAFH